MLEYREKIGEERGEERGERKKSLEIARRMLARGNASFSDIAEDTNLTLAEVEALARGEEIQ